MVILKQLIFLQRNKAMRVNIEKSCPEGLIKAPASKSMSHRLLICAGLSKGRSVISNVDFSEDIKATLRCLEAIGCRIEIKENTVTVDGIESTEQIGRRILDCGESGSTLRFFVPICLLSGNEVTLTGSKKLLSRPLEIYKNIFEKQGIKFSISENEITLCGKIKADTFDIAGNVSSQFISGLLFALPLLNEQSIINIVPPFESKPYVNMTIDVLKKFGVNAEFTDENTINIFGSQRYFPTNENAEGDWSNAAFLYAFKESGAKIEIDGLSENSIQGDKICVEYFNKLKEKFCTVDLADCPDLAPILFAFAAKHNGAKFVNTERLRIKESDRIASMQNELMKFGVSMNVGDNELTIEKCEIQKPQKIIEGHNDHRIVMSMAYLLSFTGGTIDGCEAVRKSYPDFFEVLKKAGVKIDYEA